MNEELVTVTQSQDENLMSFDSDMLLQVAERADKTVKALNKIMSAAVKITTPKDWVLIGGTPYLQESGATKVARLFGISWKILDQHAEYDSEGYPTFYYRMSFSMMGASIEAEGSRSAKDDFFSKSRGGRKSPDEIELRDVRAAAYTNAINNGIKRILPGLRNLDVETLEANGINLGKSGGYAFRSGSQGGRNPEAESGVACADCGATISQKVASYSTGKFGRALCMECQKKAGAN